MARLNLHTLCFWLCSCLRVSALNNPIIESLVVAVGQSAKLTFPGESCTVSTTCLLATTHNTVLRCEDGQWYADPAYASRLQHLSASSVVLTRVNYNDYELFEFICDNKLVKAFQLRVADRRHVSVVAEQRAVLPCHMRTGSHRAGTVRWSKDGEEQLELELLSRNTTGQMIHRASVSPDCKVTGNCSLIIEKALEGDAGDYVCSLETESPTVVNLKIDNVASPKFATTDAPVVVKNQTQEACENSTGAFNRIPIPVLVVIIIIVSGIIIVLLFVLFKKRRKSKGEVI